MYAGCGFAPREAPTPLAVAAGFAALLRPMQEVASSERRRARADRGRGESAASPVRRLLASRMAFARVDQLRPTLVSRSTAAVHCLGRTHEVSSGGGLGTEAPRMGTSGTELAGRRGRPLALTRVSPTADPLLAEHGNAASTSDQTNLIRALPPSPRRRDPSLDWCRYTKSRSTPRRRATSSASTSVAAVTGASSLSSRSATRSASRSRSAGVMSPPHARVRRTRPVE